MRQMFLLFTLLALIISGCDSQQSPPPSATSKSTVVAATSTNAAIFHQPTTPKLLELPNEALAYWRTNSEEKPALVLFSFDPLLKSVEQGVQEQARELALNGSAAQLRQHGSFNTAEPLILPIQTVAAALDSGMFSRLYWVFPSKAQPELLELELFRKQMKEQQILSDQEIAQLQLKDGIYSGTVRGLPFEARHFQKLQDITEPFVLHIDMGFFRGLYDNEVKTPLYTLLRDTAVNLRELNWRPLTTTLSYSTIDGAVSLDVRFILSSLAEILKNPTLVDGEMPQAWQVRNESLYAGEMYSESKRIELAQQIAELAPESAAAHYDRFQALFLSKQLEPALQALEQAVTLDPGYGAAYIQLAQMSISDDNAAMAIELLTKAKNLFPENAFITLQKAHILASDQLFAEATEQLQQLPKQWSPIYHPRIPAVVSKLEQQIANDSATEQKSEK